MYISVDIEADGPCPGLYSMVSLGAVAVQPNLSNIFYREIAPISDDWIPEALAVSGFTREQTQKFQPPVVVMTEFAQWLRSMDPPYVFIADNPAFDFAFINYYFHRFVGSNPFGWSARRIGDLYCGMKMDSRSSWKQLRKTKHSHNAVDDAMGNAEVLLQMKEMGLKIKLE